MKTIPKTFNKKGFNYKQIKRDGMKAIFEQSRKGQDSVSFEVVKISKHNGYELGGQKIPPGEAYPGTSQWGIAGWTFQDLKSAEGKFKKL
jgi:hypothetical protein